MNICKHGSLPDGQHCPECEPSFGDFYYRERKLKEHIHELTTALATALSSKDKLEAELAAAQSHNGKCVECGKWTCGFCGMHNSKGEWRCEVCHHGAHVCGATEALPKLEAELVTQKKVTAEWKQLCEEGVDGWKEVFRLREKLKRYGSHDYDCVVTQCPTEDVICTCGLED